MKINDKDNNYYNKNTDNNILLKMIVAPLLQPNDIVITYFVYYIQIRRIYWIYTMPWITHLIQTLIILA